MPLPQTCAFGFQWSNFFVCWNLGLAGNLVSSEMPFPGYPSIRDIPLDLLERDPFALQNALSSRAAEYVWEAAAIRAGGGVSGRPRSELQARDILRHSATELACERVRRSVAPEAACRLCCLFVADDSDQGRAYVRAIMVDRPGMTEIVPMRATVLHRVHKADARWIERYEETHDEQLLVGYWRSLACPDTDGPQWEYLIEGVIELVQKDEALLEALKRTGMRGMQNMHARSRGEGVPSN